MRFTELIGRVPESIYIHIPYCIRKCPYCDFVSYCLQDVALTTGDYIDILLKEIDLLLERDEAVPFRTIYFGGGTPSVLPAELLIHVLERIRSRRILAEDCEITLEMNPGALDSEGLAELRQAGFNRLSVGLQTSCDDLLEKIGRIHSSADFDRVIRAALAAGFRNISADLISALPGQTLSDVEADVRFLLAYPLTHISVYSLIIEEGTPFGEIYREGVRPLPDAETERAMYHKVRALLSEAGYIPYEISNYAKPGFESRHNLAYWLGMPYYGFGAGAASFVSGFRRTNPADLEVYKAQVLAGRLADVEEHIDEAEAVKEFFIFRLRLKEGFSESDYVERFGQKIPEPILETLQKFRHQGLLSYEQGRWAYTEKGLDLADLVARALI